MLCLTRNVGQSIMICDDIEIIIIKTKGCQVTLGIAAPDKIPVHRKEIYQLIQIEKESAKSTGEKQC